MNRKETGHDVNEQLLDRAIEELTTDLPSEGEIDAAASRVWKELEHDLTSTSQADASPAGVETIEGYDDYLKLIPAYLEGSLPASRRLLLEEYARESVPFRRALNAARDGEAAVKPVATVGSEPRQATKPRRHWAIAAALIAALGVVPIAMWQLGNPGGGPMATVAAEEGDLFRVGDIFYEPLALGTEISERERVRTGRGDGAVIRLRDGSLIEMKERSEISIRENRRGTTVDLERGSVIVEAAKQRDRRLYVATEDLSVAVKGTVFSVNRGMKGSRVSVIEGEVVVDDATGTNILLPGNQLATPAKLSRVPVRQEIAWSRDVDRHLAILKELVELGQEIDRSVPRPGLRYSSELLDLAPSDTVVFAALPNLGETLSEAYRIVEQRVSTNEVLSEWWMQSGPGIDGAIGMRDFVSVMTELGSALGDEVVVTGQAGIEDPIEGFAVLAELRDEDAFRSLIETQILDRVRKEVGDELDDHLVWVDDPFTAQPAMDEQVLVWTDNDLVVISTEVDTVRQVASKRSGQSLSGFAGSDFHGEVSKLYQEGAGMFVAMDLARMIDQDWLSNGSEGDFDTFERLGLANTERLLIEQKRLDDRTTHRAVLTFADDRRGIASWLAEPAPMGSLDFISPDAKLVSATVFKDPRALLEDIDGMFGALHESFGGEVESFEQRYGLSLRDDIAAALGGEVAFAVDGPMLPKPAWKLIVEVYDAARFEWAIEQALAEINRVRGESGKDAVEVVTDENRGQLFFSISGDIIDLHYTFSGGYLVAGPSRALVERALKQRDSGQSILDSPRFAALLPDDGRDNFSAIVYQDLGGLVGPMLERFSTDSLSEQQRQMLDELKDSQAPMLAYAYGERDRIIVAAESEQDIFSTSLFALLGFEQAMHSGASEEIVEEEVPATSV